MKGFMMPAPEIFITITNWLLKFTLDVSFCILLILLVRRSFMRYFGARLCRLLWLVLFIRCFVPWSFTVNYYPAALLTKVGTLFDSKPSVISPTKLSQNVSVSPEIITDKDLTIESHASLPLCDYIFTTEMLRIVLTGLWLLGLLILLGVMLIRNRQQAYITTGKLEPVPLWLQEIFLDCRERLKVKIWPILIISSGIDSPGLIGIVRPRILLPLDLVRKNNREQLYHVLMHELVHIKQSDIWLSWFWTFLFCGQWFNPLAWLAGRYMYLDREIACDERVIRLLESEKRNEYKNSIIELFSMVNLPSRRPGVAGVVERKTNIERRLEMIKKYKIKSIRQMAVGILSMLIILTLSLTSFADSGKASELSKEKAELMGRVENFFMHNYRDVTARKSIEWGKVEVDEKENRSIRYMYEAMIWDKEWKIINQVFTFDAEGKYVNVKDVSGYPKDKEIFKADTSTEEGMKALVERFFSHNYRDITARKTIEWGKAITEANGNRSIRYKYEATIWNKDKIISDKVFTFTPDGEYVSVKDVNTKTSSSLSEQNQSDLIHAYKVNKNVSDFPKGNDLSTPEAAYAAIMRNYMAAGASLSEWSEISVRKMIGTERAKVSDEEIENYLNARIIEVRIYKERIAVVIAELKYKSANGYDQRFLFYNEGQWLNSGHDGVAPTLEDARDTFARKCEKLHNVNMERVGKPIEAGRN